MTFFDLFSEGAAHYAAARPVYPDALYGFIAEHAPGRIRAWDCACGNGQAAVGLARVFEEVEASDASADQIGHAMPAPNIRYSTQAAEYTDYPNEHFDSICVAQALHWFDFDEFYAEVRRVARPGALFAAWGYSWSHITPEIDEAVHLTVREVLAPYWAENNRLLWEAYRDVPFPFDEIETPEFAIRLEWNLDEFLAHIGTWSATRRCVATIGEAWLETAAMAIGNAWGDPTVRLPVVLPIAMRAGMVSPSD